MPTITVRPMKIEDSESVKSMYDHYWHYEPDFLAHIKNRLDSYFEQTQEMLATNFKYFVAEEEGDVVGVAGIRNVPVNMSDYIRLGKGIELYILASAIRNHGVGRALVNKVIEIGKELKNTELVLFSAESHQDAYGFYSNLGFEMVTTEHKTSNGDKGAIFRMRL